MKNFLTILFIMALIIAIGCDDITKPPVDPSAKSEEQIKEQILAQGKPEETILPPLSKEELIQTYNLIVEIHNGLINWKAGLDQLKQAQDPYFSAYRNRFRKWLGDKSAILAVREQLISPEKHNLSNDHPAVSLKMAIQALKKMMDNYMRHYYFQKPFQPEYEKELRKYLDEFQEKMKTYTFAEPNTARPKP